MSTTVEFNLEVLFIYQYSNIHWKIYSTTANTFIMALYNTFKLLKGVTDSIAKFKNYILLTH